jgi:hypothetical protein
MRSYTHEGHQIHTVKMVMLNTNRDHTTEHALNIGHKKDKHKYFNDIIRTLRYKVLASLAKPYSVEESREYRRLEVKTLEAIEAAEHRMNKWLCAP